MLYDKYQFKTIDDVCGHASVKGDLKKRFKEKEYPRVSLFSGTSGIGKTNFIHLLSKTILCPNKDDQGNSCNKCKYCLAIDNGDPISNYKEHNCSSIGIKEISEIIDGSTTRSLSEVGVKIIVLDELQQLKSDDASKALLKILEKNNKNVYWIMGTMQLDKIDISIRRRTSLYNLNEISFEDLVYYMIDICKKEGISDIDTDENKAKTIFTIAENSGGSIGVALMMLERVLSSSIWTEKELIKELDLYSKSSINKILNNLLTGNSDLFSEKLTESIIQPLLTKLIIYYKYNLGVELNSFEKKEIAGLTKTEAETISFVVKELNVLSNQYYLTSQMITFSFLNILDYVKKNRKEEVRKPREPRV